VLVGIADYLKKNPAKKTEVILVSFGSEEPFMYGSWGFAREHRDLIGRALNVNMETVGAGKLGIIVEEKMYMNRYSPQAIDLIGRAGKRAGIDLPRIAITYGGTDSYSIIKGGGKSACLFGMDETELFSLWHSPLDNPDNIEEPKLQAALKICIEVIREAEGQ
jgi:Zn-dependent M28 family amino/carboxypeptidase